MMIDRLLFVLLILVMTLVSSCGDRSLVTLTNNEESTPQTEEEVEQSMPSRWQLYRAYADHNIVIVYDTKDPKIENEYKSTYTKFINSLPEEVTSRYKFSLTKATDTSLDGPIQDIVFMVGRFEDEDILSDLGSMISFSKKGDSFLFNKQNYSSEEDVLLIQNYPHPRALSLPFSLITGNDDEAILSVFKGLLANGSRFFRNSFDYTVYNNGKRKLMGAFDRNWKIDREQLFQFERIATPIISTDVVDIYSQNEFLPQEELERIAGHVSNAVSTIQSFVGTKRPVPKINYYIYKSAEEKGLQELNSTQAHIDYVSNSVHTIVNEKYKDNFIEKENQLILRHLLGASSSKALATGLGIRFSDQWQRKGYLYWGARLAASGNALTLQELTDDDLLGQESPLIADCMSGVLVDFLIDHWGKSIFLKRYNSWSPSASELEELTPLWAVHLESLVTAYPAVPREVDSRLGLKGFNFAHEGYRIFNGYMSKSATQAIQKQVDIGSNAIAIVPYSFMRDDKKPIPLRISQSPGQENDQGVIHSAYEAKVRGMKTMLKPQIYLGNAWPGSIDMKSEEDWQSFYTYYHKWIRHYALLAEIYEIDILSIGVEFVKSTLGHEEEWRKIIKSARGLFNGQITYAANWGDEFEKLSFGDELDFIGINCYYPLSKKNEVSDAELRRNFKKIKDKIRTVYDRYKKPIVFTEIGFRSIDAPWKNPHADGDDTYNEEDQNRCYQVVLDGLQGEDWYGGILWWKYPSYLSYREGSSNSFTPHNKLAEKTVQKYFKRGGVE